MDLYSAAALMSLSTSEVLSIEYSVNYSVWLQVFVLSMFLQIEEAFVENMLDDLLEENVIQPEMMDQSQEVAVEMLTHYSNKVRSRDIRQVKTYTE